MGFNTLPENCSKTKQQYTPRTYQPQQQNGTTLYPSDSCAGNRNRHHPWSMSARHNDTKDGNPMSIFVKETVSDLRSGRQTWRVFLSFCTPAFAIAVLVTLAQ